MKSSKLFSLLLCTTLVVLVRGQVSDVARQLALKWSPLVWIHEEDVFYPSTEEFYLASNELRDLEEVVVQEGLTPSNLLSGPDTSDYHINTFEDIECVHCYEDHFYGQKPINQITVHAQVTEWGDACETIDVSYPTLYPYNYGKDVCIGLEQVNASCLGLGFKTFGNHISDWEHTEIRFQFGEPTDIYLAVHSFGAYYAYNASEQAFDFYYGEPLRQSGETKIPVRYPERVFLVEGTHPEVFSANGSHGTWATEGVHTYFNFFIHLDDICGRGEPWRLWENMDFVDRSASDDALNGTEYQWLNFQGRWGNIQELECQLEPLIGECGLTSGPHGPRRSDSFPNPPVCEPAKRRT